MGAAVDPTTGLTPQQEAFAQAVASGLSQSAASAKAYNWSPDTQRSTITEAASRLSADSNVAARIVGLRASLQAAAVTDAAKILTELAKAGHAEAYGPLRWSDKVSALDKMAKILGLYKEQDDGRARPVAITQVTVILDRGDRARVVEQAPEKAPGIES